MIRNADDAIPPRLQAFGPDGFFGRLFLFDEIEGDVPQDGQIFWAVTSPDVALIFAEGHFQYTVQGIFNSPVESDDGEQVFGVRWKTGDKDTGFSGYLDVEVVGGGYLDN